MRSGRGWGRKPPGRELQHFGHKQRQGQGTEGGGRRGGGLARPAHEGIPDQMRCIFCANLENHHKMAPRDKSGNSYEHNLGRIKQIEP